VSASGSELFGVPRQALPHNRLRMNTALLDKVLLP
jgi:hypothetical protein